MTTYTDEEMIALAKKCGAMTRIKHHTNVSGDSIIFMPEELRAFASAIEQKHMARLEMMREVLDLLLRAHRITVSRTVPDTVYAAEAKLDAIRTAVNLAESALSETSDVQKWMDEQSTKAKIGLLHEMIEDIRGTDCTYYPNDLLKIIEMLENNQLRANSDAMPNTQEVKK